MQLGLVMTGTGAYAAAAVGVLQALEARGIEPYAVCAIQAGAWPAALYTAGRDAKGMACAAAQAAAAGRRMMRPRLFPRLDRQDGSLLDGRRIERLMLAQLGPRPLPLCPARGAFVCRAADSGRRVVFSSRAYRQENGTTLGMQVSLSFAARAVMALPPFLPPVQWMDTVLLPDGDVGFACRQVMLMGAQRALVIEPVAAEGGKPAPLELTAMLIGPRGGALEDEHVGVLRVPMPRGVAAGMTEKLPACVQAGRQAAERELEAALRRMGMGVCRVLPFHRSTM